MAILCECPICHKKQAVSHKRCIGKLKGGIPCEADLEKLKRQKEKVRYYISYRIPSSKGKQRMEYVGYSISEARDADGKRKVQKRENRIFDMLPESNMPFQELTDWYLDLKTVKKIASYDRLVICLKNFNRVFGDRILNTIKPVDIENYQEMREEQGRAPGTIDLEISIVKTMVNKAFDNDMVDGSVLKAFRRVKPKLRKGSNARKRTLSINEYLNLIDTASSYFKIAIIIANNTGMRAGEIKKLRWSHIDKKAMFIRLPAEITKEKRDKNIPINHHVKDALDALPRSFKNDFVLTYQGNPLIAKGGFKVILKEVCKKANIPYGRKVQNGITFHDIRRTVKTNMVNAGVDNAHRDIILGHSLQGMDVYYIAPSEETLRESMDKYTRWLDDQIANVNQTVNQKKRRVA